MTPQEKAHQLYRDAYNRWCYELSHDKNVLIAKNICEYICNEIMNAIDWHDYDSPNEEWGYWNEVKDEIKKL